MVIACSAVAVFFIFLIAEQALLRYARKQFSLVIHVNGTRGKSTVTRMIHALLLCQGVEAFGKTTGSAACLLLPDGTEKPIYRFAPANVREQRNMMIHCAFLLKRAVGEHAAEKRAEEKRRQAALVFECNAVKEELQQISMRWLRPDITVITNVREDHVQELGDVENAAKAFANAIPENSVLITPERKFMNVWEAAAKRNSLKIYSVDTREAEHFINEFGVNGEFSDNIASVFGVADYLKIDRQKALEAAAEHKRDAGAFKVYSWKAGERSFFFADGRAANDIESTDMLRSRLPSVLGPPAFQNTGSGLRRIFLLISREDRPDRTWRFLQYIVNAQKANFFDEFLFFGPVPILSLKILKRGRVNHRILASIKDLDHVLEEISEREVYIFGAGNYGGFGKQVTGWLTKKVNGNEP